MAAKTTVYHYEDGSDFPVEWASEELADRSYWWNSQHTPFACTPLSTEYLANILARSGFRDFVRFSSGEDLQSFAHPHGFMYVPLRPPTPPTSVTPDIQEIRERFNRLAPTLLHSWKSDDEPSIISCFNEIKGSTFPSMTLPQIASRLSELFEIAAEQFNLTMVAAGPMMATHLPLVGFCQREFDGDAAALVEMLEGGFSNRTTSADAQMWKQADFLRNNPDLMRRLQTIDAADTFTALEGIPDGPQFLKGLAKYLGQYGHRAEVWFELTTPTQVENLQVVLDELLRAAAGNEPNPQLATTRSARIRRATTRRLQMQLAGDPEKLAEFNRVTELARQYVPIKESRGYWQMSITGGLRMPFLNAGQILTDHGVLGKAEDIFFLHMEEIEKACANPDKATWKELVADRRTEHAARMSINPPANIGGQHEATANVVTAGPLVLAKGEVLKGLPASAGVIEGRAVVLKTLSEAAKVKARDILICNSTSPAWSILFSRISAVVTAGGGPLSHTAIVSREYKIPCVLDISGVTSRVQDGMRIRVDGTKGTVELVD